MTEYLTIAILRQAETISVADDLTVFMSDHPDASALHFAARINLSEWKHNPTSRRYISFIKSKNGRKASNYFRDFIGCQEGIDSPGGTRTLLGLHRFRKGRRAAQRSGQLEEPAADGLSPSAE